MTASLIAAFTIAAPLVKRTRDKAREGRNRLLAGVNASDRANCLERILGKAEVEVRVRPFRPLSSDETSELESAAQRYGEFAGLPERLAIVEALWEC